MFPRQIRLNLACFLFLSLMRRIVCLRPIRHGSIYYQPAGNGSKMNKESNFVRFLNESLALFFNSFCINRSTTCTYLHSQGIINSVHEIWLVWESMSGQELVHGHRLGQYIDLPLYLHRLGQYIDLPLYLPQGA
jgi:hypothetical protein